MLPFHQFLPAALKRRGYSLRSASLKINRSAPYLATLCRDESEPTLGALRDLAKLLDISIDDLVRGRDASAEPIAEAISALKASATTFAAYAEKHARDAMLFRADEPNIEVLISWFMSTGGDLAKIGPLLDFVDLYDVPQEDALRPLLHRMGPKSLSARTIESASTARLAELLVMVPAPIGRLVVVGHNRAVRQGVHSSVEQIDFPIDGGDRVSLRYYRTLFHARKNRRSFIVNFSKVIV